jgi:hypothetical protein
MIFTILQGFLLFIVYPIYITIQGIIFSNYSLDCLKMAANNGEGDASACFQRCFTKLINFVFKDDERTKANLHLLLGELIALDCNSLVVKNEVKTTSLSVSVIQILFGIHDFIHR